MISNFKPTARVLLIYAFTNLHQYKCQVLKAEK